MDNKRHISVSQLGTVKRCPKQWKFRYIDGLKTPPGIALVTGSSFDEAYNMNYSQKITTKNDLPVEEVQQKFSDELDRRILEVEDKEDVEKKDEVKDTITKGIEVFHREIAKRVEPVKVQVELRVPIDDEYEFLGFADVITQSAIVDNKTAGKYEAGKYLTQLQAYVYMWHQLTDEIKGAELHYLVKTKTPKTQIEQVNNISPEDFLHYNTETVNFIKKLYTDPDIAFRNEEGWHCSPRFCGFYNKCKGL